MSNNSLKYNIIRYVAIAFGTAVVAIAIDIFMVPNKIVPGGLSGLATVIYYLSGKRIPVGVSMLIMNVPLFFAGMRFIGKGFIFRTLFATIWLSAVIDLFQPIAEIIVQKLRESSKGNIVGDLMLYSVIGGFVMGLGLGIIFKYGATTGGSDLAARIANHFFPATTIGQVLFIVDAAVVVVASVAFGSFTLGLYAIIALYVTSKTIDALLEGISFAKAVLVISDKSGVIASRIMEEIGRGVTALKGIGMYTGNEKNVLLCVLHRAQVPTLKDITRQTDENAFVILVDIREVLGEGFGKYTR